MMKNESGRSMVEMLGVLAIIGVLSVGGIAGYTMAMNKYRANEIAAAAAQCGMLAVAKVSTTGTAISPAVNCNTLSDVSSLPTGVTLMVSAATDNTSTVTVSGAAVGVRTALEGLASTNNGFTLAVDAGA